MPMPPLTRSKTVTSYLRFISKFLFITLFIISLPLLLPSTPPEFITNITILVKFWEILRLIFIGIAVAYGLFSRKNGEKTDSVVIETQSNLYDSQTYGSSLFNNGSYFDPNGYSQDNPIGRNFESNVVHYTWNSQCFRGQSVAMVANGNCVVDEFSVNGLTLGLPVRNLKNGGKSPESHEFSGVSESSSSSDDCRNVEFCVTGFEGVVEDNVGRPLAMNQRRSRSVRMGKRGNFGNAACGHSDFRPLSVEAFESGSFQYAESSLSQGNSMNMEMAEDLLFATQETSSFTNFGNDESQVESLSGSLRAGSFSSQDSSPSRLSPLHRDSSELQNSNMEDVRKKKSSRKSYPPPSSSVPAMNNDSSSLEFPNTNINDIRWQKNFRQSYPPPSTMNNKVRRRENARASTDHQGLHFRPRSVDETQFDSIQSQSFGSTESSSPSRSSQCSETSYSPNRLSPAHAASPESLNLEAKVLLKEKISQRPHPPSATSPPLHSRHYSMPETEMQQSFENEPKDFSGDTTGNPLTVLKLGSQSFSKLASSSKASPRGKSVRTVRKNAEEVARAGEKNRNHVQNMEAGNSSKNGIKSGRIENRPISSDWNSDNSSLTKPTMPGHQKRERHEHSEKSVMESQEIPETDTCSVNENLEEEDTISVSDVASEYGQAPNEVDKKAGEFIAKFREQIRLQKVSSIDSIQGLEIRNSIFQMK
ncbi:hypothetical protein ACFE04_026652 [Oxalis oulophora]